VQVTLMDWGNCIMREIQRDEAGEVTAVSGELHLEGDFKKTKLKLTWLADVPDLVPLRLVMLGDLITKAKVRLLAAPLLREVDAAEPLQVGRVATL
jgi:glutamyl-tRNA synthetase